MRYTPLLIVLFIAAGCSNASLEAELKETQDRLNATQAELVELKTTTQKEANLVHIVLFNLKPEADQEALLAEIKKLEDIPVLQDLEVGPFENLGDDRALSDYEMIMQMSFANAEDYQAYQQHPIHLHLKELAGGFMGGPPATYDFIKK